MLACSNSCFNLRVTPDMFFKLSNLLHLCKYNATVSVYTILLLLLLVVKECIVILCLYLLDVHICKHLTFLQVFQNTFHISQSFHDIKYRKILMCIVLTVSAHP